MYAFGVIGLGVMGSNLALNMKEHDFPVAVWNRHYDKTRDFLKHHRDKKFAGTERLVDFVEHLARPCRILLMVKAGKTVDAMIEQLLTPFLFSTHGLREASADRLPCKALQVGQVSMERQAAA